MLKYFAIGLMIAILAAIILFIHVSLKRLSTFIDPTWLEDVYEGCE